MGSATRRQFLLCIAGAGGAFALDLFRGSECAANAEATAGGLKAIKRTTPGLGTEVSVIAVDESSAVAEDAISAAFSQLREVERALSIFHPASDLSRLNHAGTLSAPHPYLCRTLRAAKDMSARTGGAFDVTVQPLWEKFSASRDEGCQPSREAVEAARRRVDWRKMHVSRERVEFEREEMAATLNGMAQGFAADRMLSALRACGVRHALVNAGELGAIGKRDGEDVWTSGIQHPRIPGAYAAVVKLDGRFVSTSGDYATTFSDDFVHHHIFDPHTGYSPPELASVTVFAPSGLLADTLSTAVIVLGEDRGMQLVGTMAGADMLCVRKDGSVVATKGCPVIG